MMVLCTETTLSGLKTAIRWPFKVLEVKELEQLQNLGRELQFEP